MVATTSRHGLLGPQLASCSGLRLAIVILIVACLGPASASFVAVGSGGTTAYSPDGSQWTLQTPIVFPQLTDVARLGSLWVIVSAGGSVTSPDGLAWTPHVVKDALGNSWVPHAVACDATQCLATNDRGIYRSQDGINWKWQAPSSAPGGAAGYVALRGIALGKDSAGASLWVAVGDNALVMASPDGITWAVQTGLPALGLGAGLKGVVYGAGLWVAVGDDGLVMTSSDGAIWTSVPSGVTNGLTGIAYGAGTWVAMEGAGSTAILTSAGPPSWNWSPQAMTMATVDVAYNGGWVAVGSTNAQGTVLTSPGGAPNSAWTWSAATVPTVPNLRAVAWANGWAALGAGSTPGGFGTILTSPDGTAWTAQAVTNRTGADLYDVAYGQGQWVAVGGGGTILTSPDGTTWTPRASPTMTTWRSIATNGSLWIASSDGLIIESNDAKTWRQVCPAPPGSGNVCPSAVFNSLMGFDIATDGVQWVIVGDGGHNNFNSTDGLHWQSHPSGASTFIQGIAYGNGMWMEVGDCAILTTPAGPAPSWIWTPQNFGACNGQRFWQAAYAEPRWFVAGPGILMSQDYGQSWKVQSGGGYQSIAFDGKAWVASKDVGSLNGRFDVSVDGSAWSTALTINKQWIWNVAAAPRPSCSPTQQEVFAWDPATFTADGGASPYSWTAPGSGNPGPLTGDSITESYPNAGVYDVSLTDSAGQTEDCQVRVQDHLACSPLTETVDVGQQVWFNAAGGTPSYAWDAPHATPAAASDASAFTATYGAPGNYTVTVMDSDVTPATASCAVTVRAPAPPPPDPTPSSPGPPASPMSRPPDKAAAGWSAGNDASAGKNDGAKAADGPRPTTSKALGNAPTEGTDLGSPAAPGGPADALAIAIDHLLDPVLRFQSNRVGGTFGWDFGDGSPIDTAATPAHAYAVSGAYVVRLLHVTPDGQLESTTAHVVAKAPLSPKASMARTSQAWTPMPMLAVIGAALGAILLFSVRGGWPYVVLVFFSRLRNSDLASHPVRGAILDILATQPGIHENALSRLIGRDQKTVGYHLRVLCASGLVRKERWEGTTGYWLQPSDGSPVNLGGSASLRVPNAKRILALVRKEPGLTPGELARKAGLHPWLVQYHVGRLSKAGLVATRPEDGGGRTHVFAIGSG